MVCMWLYICFDARYVWSFGVLVCVCSKWCSGVFDFVRKVAFVCWGGDVLQGWRREWRGVLCACCVVWQGWPEKPPRDIGGGSGFGWVVGVWVCCGSMVWVCAYHRFVCVGSSMCVWVRRLSFCCYCHGTVVLKVYVGKWWWCWNMGETEAEMGIEKEGKWTVCVCVCRDQVCVCFVPSMLIVCVYC